MAKLELSLLVGDASKEWLGQITLQVDRLEELVTRLEVVKLVGHTENSIVHTLEDEAIEPREVEDEEEGFTVAPPKKTTKAVKAPAPEEWVDEEETEEEEVELAPPKKKAKKLTVDDVNDACKARASAVGGKKGRQEVLEILKKKFKTESVSELTPDQYAPCVQAMQVSQ